MCRPRVSVLWGSLTVALVRQIWGSKCTQVGGSVFGVRMMEKNLWEHAKNTVKAACMNFTCLGRRPLMNVPTADNCPSIKRSSLEELTLKFETPMYLVTWCKELIISNDVGNPFTREERTTEICWWQHRLHGHNLHLGVGAPGVLSMGSRVRLSDCGTDDIWTFC